MDVLTVDLLHLDGHAVVALRGELDQRGEHAVDAALGPLVARYDASQVELDCGALTFVDPAGLSALIRAARGFGGEERITLRDVQPPVMRLLEVTNARHLFHVVDAEGEPCRW
ncbi:MAG: Anti-sigma factor antagonist [Actinomycetia bacterium]|nr:Anti-sigma factor antagonist [Actinomycetes bacterium]